MHADMGGEDAQNPNTLCLRDPSATAWWLDIELEILSKSESDAFNMLVLLLLDYLHLHTGLTNHCIFKKPGKPCSSE